MRTPGAAGALVLLRRAVDAVDAVADPVDGPDDGPDDGTVLLDAATVLPLADRHAHSRPGPGQLVPDRERARKSECGLPDDAWS